MPFKAQSGKIACLPNLLKVWNIPLQNYGVLKEVYVPNKKIKKYYVQPLFLFISHQWSVVLWKTQDRDSKITWIISLQNSVYSFPQEFCIACLIDCCNLFWPPRVLFRSSVRGPLGRCTRASSPGSWVACPPSSPSRPSNQVRIATFDQFYSRFLRGV